MEPWLKCSLSSIIDSSFQSNLFTIKLLKNCLSLLYTSPQSIIYSVSLFLQNSKFESFWPALFLFVSSSFFPLFFLFSSFVFLFSSPFLELVLSSLYICLSRPSKSLGPRWCLVSRLLCYQCCPQTVLFIYQSQKKWISLARTLSVQPCILYYLPSSSLISLYQFSCVSCVESNLMAMRKKKSLPISVSVYPT